MSRWLVASMMAFAACSFESASSESAAWAGSGTSTGGTGSPTTTGASQGSATASGTSTTTPTPGEATTASASSDAGTAVDDGDSSEAGSGTDDGGDSSGSSGTDGAVQAALETVRLELPCIGTSNCSSSYCDSPGTSSAMQALVGEDGTTYDVTIRVRGVVEQKSYVGGTTDGFWNEGGAPASDDWNVYQLEISDPAQLYHINAGSSGNAYCDALDYSRTVPMRSGATLTVAMVDTNSCGAYNVDSDGTPIVIDGIPPAPDPFDGQFVQVDATSIVPL